ncbi:MAG: hypothetical protein IAE67_06965 [Candidatus Competibacteraceae bacterium]|nr:hypothetical protein [Candidatus Competibacteraceae bacterium]
MIIRLFKTNQITGLFFLLLFQSLVYLNAFLHPFYSEQIIQHPALYRFMLGDWIQISWLSALISFSLVLLQALWFNYFIHSTNLLGQPTYLPGFFYVLICSLFPQNLFVSPSLLANIFLLPGIIGIWQIAHTKSHPRLIFFTAISFSMAALIYPPALVLFPWFLWSLFVFSTPMFRHILVAMLGWLLPFFYVLLVYFINDNVSFFLQDFFISPFGLPDYRLHTGLMEYIILAWLLAMLIASFYRYLQTIHYYKVVQKRTFRIWGAMLVLLIASAFFYNFLPFSHIVVVGYPLSIFYSTFFLHLRKLWISDLLTLLIIVCLLVLQFSVF